jgi:hypothetical protein
VAPSSYPALASILLMLNMPDYLRDVEVTYCEDTSWCRGGAEPARQCCRWHNGLFIKDSAVFRPPTPKTSSSVVQTSVTSSPTAAPTPSRNPISAAAMAGIGVGAGLGVGAGICLVAIGALVGVRMLRRRRNRSDKGAIEEEKEVCLRCSVHNDESLAPPRTPIYSAQDLVPESAELEWRLSRANERLSYMYYPTRAPDLQDVPAELPSERRPEEYDIPGSI